jgi:mannose-6-phosphate isomerase
MTLNFSDKQSKAEVFQKIQSYLKEEGLVVIAKDETRPWGGFFVMDETQAQKFGALFFPTVNIAELKNLGKLSPKILVVEPGRRLSWQYHHRRAEIWRLIAGEAGIVRSETDQEGRSDQLKLGEVIRLRCGERHRLLGLQSWGVISEIWQHTDALNPSNEEDIVRVQDDFGR